MSLEQTLASIAYCRWSNCLLVSERNYHHFTSIKEAKVRENKSEYIIRTLDDLITENQLTFLSRSEKVVRTFNVPDVSKNKNLITPLFLIFWKFLRNSLSLFRMIDTCWMRNDFKSLNSQGNKAIGKYPHLHLLFLSTMHVVLICLFLYDVILILCNTWPFLFPLSV